MRTSFISNGARRRLRRTCVRGGRLRRQRQRVERRPTASTSRERHGAAVVVVRASDYKGSGSRDVIIASDLPLQGAGRAQTTQMVQAIKFALKQRNLKAGGKQIGYQSCDDSTAQAGAWDSAKCAANARAYAANKIVIGVVGTFNSGLREDHRADAEPCEPRPDGDGQPGEHESGPDDEGPGAAPVSRTSTTRPARATTPASWRTTRSRARRTQCSRSRSALKKVYVLNDKQTYGAASRRRSRTLRRSSGSRSSATRAGTRSSPATRRSRTRSREGADGVFLGGIICNNGAKLIKDLKAGRSEATADPRRTASAIRQVERGTAADGAYMSVAGQPPNGPDGRGQDVRRRLRQPRSAQRRTRTRSTARRRCTSCSTPSTSPTARGASVAKSLFGLKITDGIIGTFTINEKGDTSLKPITIYQQTGRDAQTDQDDRSAGEPPRG